MDDFTAWRCKHDDNKFCPPEGCPAIYGCARDKGWKDGQASPPECQGIGIRELIADRNKDKP